MNLAMVFFNWKTSSDHGFGRKSVRLNRLYNKDFENIESDISRELAAKQSIPQHHTIIITGLVWLDDVV